MRRVDVVAQPYARIGEREAGRRSRLRERGNRVAGRPLRPLGEPERRRDAVAVAALEPRRDERVVVVAGHEHDLAVGAERRARLREERPRRRERLAQRPLAQLERVAEQHEPLDPVT